MRRRITIEQRDTGIAEGRRRRVENKPLGVLGRRHVGKPELAEAHDCMGATAELVAALEMGVEWEPARFKDRYKPDVAGWDVKSTLAVPGHLIIHPYQPAHRPYMFVVPISADRLLWDIPGWCWGHEGKVDRYYRRDKDSFWIPRRALTPFTADIEPYPAPAHSHAGPDSAPARARSGQG